MSVSHQSCAAGVWFRGYIDLMYTCVNYLDMKIQGEKYLPLVDSSMPSTLFRFLPIEI